MLLSQLSILRLVIVLSKEIFKKEGIFKIIHFSIEPRRYYLGQIHIDHEYTL